MRVTIDTERKVVEIDESVNLKEMVDVLKSLTDDWKEYTIENKIEWPYWYKYPYFNYPTTPIITYTTSG